ncbi:MAG: OsmC family protein [Deltaproteobacteria bacterium]|nr:OsmC family protein [Deltaproteobacteria bacterium]
MKEIRVCFPGGLRVDAEVDGRLIPTDQAVEEGGGGTAPEPFYLFLASIATCAGIYALRFCQRRGIDTRDMTLTMACEYDEDIRLYRKMTIDLKLPPGFPEKYRGAIIKSMDLCAVKKHILNPPQFEIKTS